MERITRKHIEATCAAINRELGTPETPYTEKAGGGLKANVGNYHVSGAYGGYCIHRMSNESGGVSTPIMYGHIPARQCNDQARAFLAGLIEARRGAHA